MEVKHKMGDKDRGEAKLHTGKDDLMCREETLNGSDNLATYDVLVKGMCKGEFWPP